MNKENLENDIKKVIETLYNNADDYEFYNDFLFNAEEIMDSLFRNYIELTEGSSCCGDKSSFIVRRIKCAIKERKNMPLSYTYAEYRDNGGNLGGINETNTDLNKVCYWCPKTIKDTDSAIDLFFSLLNMPRYVKTILDEKEQKIIELQNQLKIAEEMFDILYDRFIIVAFDCAKINVIPSKSYYKELAENKLKGDC